MSKISCLRSVGKKSTCHMMHIFTTIKTTQIAKVFWITLKQLNALVMIGLSKGNYLLDVPTLQPLPWKVFCKPNTDLWVYYTDIRTGIFDT